VRIEIEFSPPAHSACECCGGTTTTLTRFLTIDDEARGVYYAAFSDNHPEPHVIVLLSLGKWWDGTGPDDRCAFGLRLWLVDDQFQVGVIDANAAGWPNAKLMGRRLSREEALEHPQINEAFHVSDHITGEDEPIRNYFRAKLTPRDGTTT